MLKLVFSSFWIVQACAMPCPNGPKVPSMIKSLFSEKYTAEEFSGSPSAKVIPFLRVKLMERPLLEML